MPLLVLAESALPISTSTKPVLQQVEFRDLKRTRPAFLRSVMRSQEGTPFQKEQWQEDIRQLASWGLFSYVNEATYPAQDGVTAVVSLGDRWSITPVFQPSFGGDVLSVIGGLRDTNFLGRFYEIGGYGGLRRDPYNTYPLFGMWLRMPFVGGTDYRWEISFDARFLNDPLYLDGSSTPIFSQQWRQWSLYSAFGHHINSRLEAALAGEWSITNTGIDPVYASAATTYQSLVVPTENRFRIAPVLRYDSTSMETEPLLKGWYVHLVPNLLVANRKPVADLRGTVRFYQFWTQWFNLATQMRLQWVSSNAWQVLRPVGGLTKHVRGYRERYFHARGVASWNLEVRTMLFRTPWLGIQPRLFVDAAVLRQRSLGTVWQDWLGLYSFGGGLYAWVPKIHKMRLRIDVARPLDRGMIGGFPEISLEASQFF